MNLLVFFLIIGASAPVCAQMVDPFSSAGSGWVSLDSYDKHATEPEKTTDQKVQELMQATAQSAQGAQAKPKTEAQARPERALNFPVFPGQAARSGVVITSTEEDNKSWIQEKKDWAEFKKADEEAVKQEAANQKLSEHNAGADDHKKDLFGVRYATLPSSQIQSIPADRISKPKLDREAQAAKDKAAAQGQGVAQGATSNKSKVTKETTEACEAFVDYHRRQLAAVESDRRTLAQLKAALAELGLVDKLSFMAGQTSALVESTTPTAQTLTSKQP